MTDSELKKAAMKGKEMPDNLSLPDRWLYPQLVKLYKQFEDKTISKEAGMERISALFQERDYRNEQIEEYSKILETSMPDFQDERWKNAILAFGNYYNIRTSGSDTNSAIETADNVFSALFGEDTTSLFSNIA